jgi:hypothetical protein
MKYYTPVLPPIFPEPARGEGTNSARLLQLPGTEYEDIQ